MSHLALPPPDHPIGQRPPLEATLAEAMMLLGEREMMLEYVPGAQKPWRVRYKGLRYGGDGPAMYYIHAWGDTWEQALGAALRRTITERKA